MKKTIIIILTLAISCIAIIAYNVYNYKANQIQAQKNNASYTSFYGQEVLGTDVITIINKAIDNNEKNKVEKDEKGIYIENDTNSVKIEVKFLELDNTISMEAINNQGATRFAQNFGAIKFKCTKIEYHSKTGNVKYMYFEQI